MKTGNGKINNGKTRNLGVSIPEALYWHLVEEAAKAKLKLRDFVTAKLSK